MMQAKGAVADEFHRHADSQDPRDPQDRSPPKFHVAKNEGRGGLENDIGVIWPGKGVM
jgi:hypothetical protein